VFSRLIDLLRHDIRDAGRSLARRPGFTAVAVLSLAIGIGANTTIFTLVNAVILQDLPVDKPERMVNLYLNQAAFQNGTISYPEFIDLREGTNEVFSDLGAMQLALTQIDRAGGVEMVAVEAVTGNYFRMLGIEAALGRTLQSEDDVSRGGHPVVMLNHAYWRDAMGGDPGIVGREVRLGGRAYTIVGVAPPDFPGTLRGITSVMYAPYVMIEELTGGPMFEERGNHSLFVKARMRPGVTLPQVEVAVAAVGARLREERVEGWDPDNEFAVVPMTEVLLFPPLDPYIAGSAWLLTAVVALVLLLACTNLATFLLARGLDRRREIAVRLALGASRASLVRGLLVETTLLSLLAGSLGVALATWSLQWLLAADLPLPIPVSLDLRLNTTVLLFTMSVSLIASALLGLVPAVQSTRPDLVPALKSDSAGGGRPGHIRWRNGLVIAQLTISIVLLAGAGLFLRSLQQVQAVDPGFGHSPAAVMTFLVPSTRFDADAGRAYVERMLDRFRALPGVEAIGIIDNLHLNPLSSQDSDFNVDGHAPPEDHESFIASRAVVDAGFFGAADIRLLRGRNFADSDLPDTQAVAIISEAMARRFWPDGDAVGRLIRTPSPNVDDLVIVGVVSDAKIRTLGEAPRNTIYRPFSQAFARDITVVARATDNPEGTVLAMLEAGRQVDPNMWVWEVKTMERHLAVMHLAPQLSAFILSAFAALALALSSIGLYGVVSYAMAQRTREVGIRMALGASPSGVVRLLTVDGLKLVLVGAALGLAAAFAVSRLLSGLLFGIGAFDLVTFIVAPTVLGASASLAAWLPARRASRVDPMLAMRAE
jgi:putative ABC transport system permease protein